MKRIAIIVGSLLLLLLITIVIIYTVRKNDINKQYVGKASTSILSVSVDDLLIDNISSLFSWSNTRTGEGQQELWIKKILWNAGIKIPARIYLFSVTPQKSDFYGKLAIKNYDDCLSFFSTQYPEGIKFLDQKQGIIGVEINNNIKLLFDRNSMIYKISIENNSGFEDLQFMLEHADSWVQIGSFPAFEHALSQKHISYVQKDKSFKIEAQVTKHKTEIAGEWFVSTNLANNFKVRTIDTTHQVVTFWNLLPLKDTPLLSYFMRKYSGLTAEQLNNNDANYFDLEIKPEHTIQKDTAITYGYDDDFNQIEELKIKEVSVPYIVHTWKFTDALAESLPNKMFYQFYKKRVAQYLFNSTSESTTDLINSKQTINPFYLFIDFDLWPQEWTQSIFKKLKDNKVKTTIMTTVQDRRSLIINGQINY